MNYVGIIYQRHARLELNPQFGEKKLSSKVTYLAKKTFCINLLLFVTIWLLKVISRLWFCKVKIFSIFFWGALNIRSIFKVELNTCVCNAIVLNIIINCHKNYIVCYIYVRFMKNIIILLNPFLLKFISRGSINKWNNIYNQPKNA